MLHTRLFNFSKRFTWNITLSSNTAKEVKFKSKYSPAASSFHQFQKFTRKERSKTAEGNNGAAWRSCRRGIRTYVRRSNFENLFIAYVSRARNICCMRVYIHRHRTEKEIYVSYACWHVLRLLPVRRTRRKNFPPPLLLRLRLAHIQHRLRVPACQRCAPKICIYFRPSCINIRFTSRKRLKNCVFIPPPPFPFFLGCANAFLFPALLLKAVRKAAWVSPIAPRINVRLYRYTIGK